MGRGMPLVTEGEMDKEKLTLDGDLGKVVKVFVWGNRCPLFRDLWQTKVEAKEDVFYRRQPCIIKLDENNGWSIVDEMENSRIQILFKKSGLESLSLFVSLHIFYEQPKEDVRANASTTQQLREEKNSYLDFLVGMKCSTDIVMKEFENIL